MGKLELQQMVLGPVYTNCYFLKNKETGEALIVDPADSPNRIFQKVEDMGAKPVGILLTHGHFDHIMAVQAVKAEYQIPVYACRQEEEMLREPSVNMTDRCINHVLCVLMFFWRTCKYLKLLDFLFRCSTLQDTRKEAVATI